MSNKVPFMFILLSLFSLLFAVFLGCLASIQYIYPSALEGVLSFQMLRPLHVSMVIAWIFSSALAGIYYYLPKVFNRPLYSNRLVRIHFFVFVATGIVILYAYFNKVYGGREYWAFPPHLSIPIFISWVLLIVNFFATLVKYIISSLSINTSFLKSKVPVYIWMWGVGILFFFFTFIESYLWLFPYFKENIVRDIMVQWKSYGSLVGSWNLLVYGTAIYVMDKISGESSATSKMSYFLFFLGLSNLILGWSHHVYILPTAKWIRYVGYAISMTELFILARLIWEWGKSINPERKEKFRLPYLFMIAADFWIIANLFLAILMSVPAINIYTHGTHITVAHAMGSTIGINTMILLSSIIYILYDSKKIKLKIISESGFWIMNISFLLFWINLIVIGLLKSYYDLKEFYFQQIMQLFDPYFIIFFITGLGIFVGVLFIVLPILKRKNITLFFESEQ